MRALTLPLGGLRDSVLIPQRSRHSLCSVSRPTPPGSHTWASVQGYDAPPLSVPDPFCSITEEDGVTFWVGKGVLNPLSLGFQQTEKPGVSQKGHRQTLEARDPALATF